jgi:hypothetical protein
MARYSLSYSGVTATAFADTTGLTDNAYNFHLRGGGSTQRLLINEVYMGGEVTSGLLLCKPVLARDSTVAVTSANGDCRNALMDGSATAPGTLAAFGNSAATDPQRDTALHLLHLSFQPYGGVVRWQARHGEEIIVVGNTASLGEVSLSSFTGTAAGCVSSGHCIYEVA